MFTLKERRYLGPTSMDAEMAFVMANMVTGGGVGWGEGLGGLGVWVGLPLGDMRESSRALARSACSP
jgi:hypothetical protein